MAVSLIFCETIHPNWTVYNFQFGQIHTVQLFMKDKDNDLAFDPSAIVDREFEMDCRGIAQEIVF